MSALFAVSVSESSVHAPDTVLVEADSWTEEGSWVKFFQGSRFVSAFANRNVLRVTTVIEEEVLA